MTVQDDLVPFSHLPIYDREEMDLFLYDYSPYPSLPYHHHQTIVSVSRFHQGLTKPYLNLVRQLAICYLAAHLNSKRLRGDPLDHEGKGIFKNYVARVCQFYLFYLSTHFDNSKTNYAAAVLLSAPVCCHH